MDEDRPRRPQTVEEAVRQAYAAGYADGHRDGLREALDADEPLASRLEFKVEQALLAQPDDDWPDDVKRDFRLRKEGRASAFAEAAQIIRGQAAAATEREHAERNAR